jgi:hypothetical protein
VHDEAIAIATVIEDAATNETTLMDVLGVDPMAVVLDTLQHVAMPLEECFCKHGCSYSEWS